MNPFTVGDRVRIMDASHPHLRGELHSYVDIVEVNKELVRISGHGIAWFSWTRFEFASTKKVMQAK